MINPKEICGHDGRSSLEVITTPRSLRSCSLLYLKTFGNLLAHIIRAFQLIKTIPLNIVRYVQFYSNIF